MDLLNFVNTYWPVIAAIGGFIAWLVGLQHKINYQARQIETLFDLQNGKDPRRAE